MRRSLTALTLLAGLLVGACSSAAAPTPQIVYVTPQPTAAATPTARPTPKPTARPVPAATPKPTTTLASGGILGEAASDLTADLEPLGYTFESSAAPNGEPMLTGTNGEFQGGFIFIGDPVTSMAFYRVGDKGGFDALGALLRSHGRADALQWLLDELGALTGPVNASRVLGDGTVVTIVAEMSGSDIAVTVTLTRP